MKRSTLPVYGVLILIFIIPLIFYLYFAIGVSSTNSPKTIKQNWVMKYKTIIKKDFSYINDVTIYYQQGRVYFDFATNNELSLEDCKQITKMTKDFIEKEIASNPLTEDGFEQLNISLHFDINKNSYVFESSYWTNAQENTKNSYKTWHLKINDVLQEKLEF